MGNGMIFDATSHLFNKVFNRKDKTKDMNDKDKTTVPEDTRQDDKTLHSDDKTANVAKEETINTDAAAAETDKNADSAGTNTDKKAAANGKNDKHDKHHKEDKVGEAQAKVQEMGEKLAAINDKYVRLYSEYENYRKRTNLEKAELLLNGGKEVLKAVLPIVDDMERALKNIPDDNTAKEGVQLVYNKLMAMLNQKGVTVIEAQGAKFDENLHEAVTRIPAADEKQKGLIVDVIEKGYMLNDKVLRFPKVVVAF